MGGAVVDAQGARAAADVHAVLGPGEGLLEDPLTEVPRKEQGIGAGPRQGGQKTELGGGDVLAFVHHDVLVRPGAASVELLGGAMKELVVRDLA